MSYHTVVLSPASGDMQVTRYGSSNLSLELMHIWAMALGYSPMN